MNWLILFTVGFFVVSYAESATAFITQKQISISTWSFDAATSSATDYNDLYFDVGIQIINPTKFKIGINSVTANIIYNGYIIGTVTNDTAFEIIPNSYQLVPATLDVSTADIIDNVPDIVNTLIANGTIPVTVQGYVSTSVADINFSLNVNA